jgi:hypothetical protein
MLSGCLPDIPPFGSVTHRLRSPPASLPVEPVELFFLSHFCVSFFLLSQLPVSHFWFQALTSTLAGPICVSHSHFIASHFCRLGLRYLSFTFPPIAPLLLLPSLLKPAANERPGFPDFVRLQNETINTRCASSPPHVHEGYSFVASQ